MAEQQTLKPTRHPFFALFCLCLYLPVAFILAWFVFMSSFRLDLLDEVHLDYLVQQFNSDQEFKLTFALSLYGAPLLYVAGGLLTFWIGFKAGPPNWLIVFCLIPWRLVRLIGYSFRSCWKWFRWRKTKAIGIDASNNFEFTDPPLSPSANTRPIPVAAENSAAIKKKNRKKEPLAIKATPDGLPVENTPQTSTPPAQSGASPTLKKTTPQKPSDNSADESADTEIVTTAMVWNEVEDGSDEPQTIFPEDDALAGLPDSVINSLNNLSADEDDEEETFELSLDDDIPGLVSADIPGLEEGTESDDDAEEAPIDLGEDVSIFEEAEAEAPSGEEETPIKPEKPKQKDFDMSYEDYRSIIITWLKDRKWVVAPDMHVNADAGQGFEPDNFDDDPTAIIPIVAIRNEVRLISIMDLDGKAWEACNWDFDRIGLGSWRTDDGDSLACPVSTIFRSMWRFNSHHGNALEASGFHMDDIRPTIFLINGTVSNYDEVVMSWEGADMTVIVMDDTDTAPITEALGLDGEQSFPDDLIQHLKKSSAETQKLLEEDEAA